MKLPKSPKNFVKIAQGKRQINLKFSVSVYSSTPNFTPSVQRVTLSGSINENRKIIKNTNRFAQKIHF